MARGGTSAAHRGAMLGNTNAAKWGKAKRVDVGVLRAYSLAIGRNVRQVRTERCISLDELSAASGVDRWAISRLEHGHTRGKARNPLFLTIVRLALALELSPSELVP